MEPARLGFHSSPTSVHKFGNWALARSRSSHNHLCRLRDDAVFHNWISDCIFFGATRRQTKTIATGFNYRAILGELLNAHARLGQLAQQRRLVY